MPFGIGQWPMFASPPWQRSDCLCSPAKSGWGGHLEPMSVACLRAGRGKCLAAFEWSFDGPITYLGATISTSHFTRVAAVCYPLSVTGVNAHLGYKVFIVGIRSPPLPFHHPMFKLLELPCFPCRHYRGSCPYVHPYVAHGILCFRAGVSACCRH